MKKISRIVLLLIIIAAIGASVLVAKTEVFANQLVLSSEIIKPIDPVEGKYSVSYADATAGKQYLLLVVTGGDKEVEDLTLSDSNINYIDQAEATDEGVSFNNFIPKNIEDSTVFLTGSDLAEPIVLGYIYGIGGDGVSVSGTVTFAGKTPATITLTNESTKVSLDPVQTGTNGSFIVENVPDGTYTLKATKGGHTSYTITGLVVASEEITLSKSLTLYGGDADVNDEINYYDINAIVAHYGMIPSEIEKIYPDADDNGDINYYDINIAVNNYSQESIEITYEVFTEN